MTWADALDRYGTDKPDLRFGMTLCDLSDVFATSEVKAFAAPTVKALRVPGGASFTRSRLDQLTDQAKSLGAKGLAWFRVTSEGLDSPLARFLSDDEAAAIATVDGAKVGDLVLVVADEYAAACHVLGALRVTIGSPPVGEGPHHYVWVTDFPMFEGLDEDGNLQAAHHPFTMPHPEDLALIETDPLEVRAQAYDLVLNGWELGSGSVRIHRADIQSRVFRALGHQRRGGPEPLRLPAGRLSSTARRPTRASPSASTGWSRSSPARRTFARSSPSPRPSRAPIS